MIIEPRSTRSSKLKKGVTKIVEESNEDGERADGSAEDEEEDMDCAYDSDISVALEDVKAVTAEESIAPEAEGPLLLILVPF